MSITMRCASFLVSLLIISSCRHAGPTAPTSPRVQELLIEAPSSIKVGLNKPVAAKIRMDGQARPVQAAWVAEPVETVEFIANSIRGLTPGMAVLAARYEALKATVNVTVVPDAAGTWLGQIRLTACTRESGGGSNPCKFAVGFTQPFRLSISHDGTPLTGHLDVFERTISGDVQGKIEVDGQVMLSGKLDSADSHVTFSDWVSSFRRGIWSPAPLKWRRSFTNGFGAQVIEETWEFIDRERTGE